MDSSLFIGEIVERESPQGRPVAFPTPTASATGFPRNKRRWVPSASKQQHRTNGQLSDASRSSRNGGDAAKTTESGREKDAGFDEIERRRIDYENRQQLASMSPQEIAQAQDDIMNGLNPALIQRLLQRANIDEKPSSSSPFHATKQDTARELQTQASRTDPPHPTEKSGSGQVPHVQNEARPKPRRIADDYDEDRPPPQIPADLFPITDLSKATHFPVPPNFPDLDPSDPDFLSTLHEKYFPNLPADPSKLAWMAPVPTTDSPADKDSTYYPHPEISISALRFDFRGRFLSPRISRTIPSNVGLHHHGEAPEAAGYTIAEMARLARSAVPAQRCMAFQTLGRILYRLGRGEWGKTEDDHVAMGIWAAVKKGRILESLMEAAAGEGGHRGSRAYATEALWLFERGGWKEKFKGR